MGTILARSTGEQAFEEALATRQPEPSAVTTTATGPPGVALAAVSDGGEPGQDFDKICFYITPIGEDGSEERRHADFLMEYIIKPAVLEPF